MRRLDGREAAELAGLAAVFDDLQYTLRCCEHLVGALARPDCRRGAGRGAVDRRAGRATPGRFSARTKVLAEADLDELKLDGDVAGFHRAVVRLRDHYASRHGNPRETFTVGVAQRNDGTAAGVAVVGAPQPGVDDTTVRQLGRIAYGLSGLVDARMQAAQQRVHVVAQGLAAPPAHGAAAGGRGRVDLSTPRPDQQVLQLVARGPPAGPVSSVGEERARSRSSRSACASSRSATAATTGGKCRR